MPEKQYGLTDERDSDGNRKAVEHSYEWDGQDIHIKLIPPTISEIEEYEEFGEEMPASKLRDVIDDHIVKPEVEDPTMREVMCYIEGIIDYAGEGNELANAAQEELESRSNTGKN